MVTRSGIAVVLVMVVSAVAGFVLGYPEFVLVAAAAAGALLVAAFWLRLTPDVTITRQVWPQRVSQGQQATGVLTVTNTSRRRSPPIAAQETVGAATVPIVAPSLPPGGHARRDYRIPTSRRGVFEIGPLRIGHADPLRLVQVTQTRAERLLLRVRPLVHAVAPLPTGGSPELDGLRATDASRGGIAFHSLRDYAEGDDLRLVHWPSTARAGRLMVRHTVVPNDPAMLIVLDTSAGPYADDSFEDAVRVAASLAVSGHAHGFPVELATTAGARVAAGRGTSSADAALDLLAEVAPSRDDPGLLALVSLAPPEAAAVLGVVTGQAPAATLAAVPAVRRRFATVSVIQVGERFGRPATLVAGAQVVNVRTSEEFAAVWPAGAHR